MDELIQVIVLFLARLGKKVLLPLFLALLFMGLATAIWGVLWLIFELQLIDEGAWLFFTMFGATAAILLFLAVVFIYDFGFRYPKEALAVLAGRPDQMPQEILFNFERIGLVKQAFLHGIGSCDYFKKPVLVISNMPGFNIFCVEHFVILTKEFAKKVDPTFVEVAVKGVFGSQSSIRLRLTDYFLFRAFQLQDQFASWLLGVVFKYFRTLKLSIITLRKEALKDYYESKNPEIMGQVHHPDAFIDSHQTVKNRILTSEENQAIILFDSLEIAGFDYSFWGEMAELAKLFQLVSRPDADIGTVPKVIVKDVEPSPKAVRQPVVEAEAPEEEYEEHIVPHIRYNPDEGLPEDWKQTYMPENFPPPSFGERIKKTFRKITGFFKNRKTAAQSA